MVKTSWILPSLAWLDQSNHKKRWLNDVTCLSVGSMYFSNFSEYTNMFHSTGWFLYWKCSLLNTGYYLAFQISVEMSILTEFYSHDWGLNFYTSKEVSPSPYYSLSRNISYCYICIWNTCMHGCVYLVYSCLSPRFEIKFMEGWLTGPPSISTVSSDTEITLSLIQVLTLHIIRCVDLE